MQSIKIDPELNRLALAEAAKLYPEFADQASHVIARPLSQGFAWQLVWKGTPSGGQQEWEFQNAAIRAYKRLACVGESCKTPRIRTVSFLNMSDLDGPLKSEKSFPLTGVGHDTSPACRVFRD
jgi:hypothetical protein